MKRLKNPFILIMAVILPWLASAAKKENPELKRVSEIKGNTEMYIYGEGYGMDREEAYHGALYDMVRKISVTVMGSVHTETSEEYGDGTSSRSSEKFRSVVDSYTSTECLEGVREIVLDDGPGYHFFVYMPKANVELMHQRRQKHVADLARNGVTARDNGKVDDALRYLYRSYVLLQSLPHPSEVTEYVDDGDRKLDIWLPEAMDEIVRKVSFGVASVGNDTSDPDNPVRTVELTVGYDGRPATTCAFKYGTQTGYSPLIIARDGVAVMELDSKVPLDPLRLYVEYQFKDENHVNAELKPMLDNFRGTGLVHNEIAVNHKPNVLKADKKEARVFRSAVAACANEGIVSLDDAEAAPYRDVMEIILKAVRTRDYTGIDQYFTEDGRKIFDKLIRYGKVRILGKPTGDTFGYYPFRGNVMCRSVPMSFTFSGKRQFTEDVTFTFNSDCKIESLAFGLGSIARKDIFAKEGAAWTDDKKMVIVNFLENYRTAFALKELDYIESIFDDDAVIVVGHVTKRLEKVRGSGDAMGFASKEQVTYATKSKSEYLEQLRRCFGSQEFINLRFSDTDIERSGVGGDTFAIQLRQDYVSQTYGDQGYLFLFMDFNDIEKPQIHVRTWQPERNPDLTPNLPPDHPRYGIFSPASF